MQKRNILILGGGGREHAIAYQLRQSKRVGTIYACPGNGGIGLIENCHCIPIKATDTAAVTEFLKRHKDIYLTIVSPDDALALGMVNEINASGFRAFGPTKEAAEIEWSKAYSKGFMKKYNIPTASYEVFSETKKALKHLKTVNLPIVIKADGLALGKGVLICPDLAGAEAAVKSIMEDQKFGKAGERVVIEEYVTGYEVTILAFTDGKTLKPMVTSRDYKRAYDNDEGLNTGGMGSVSPLPPFKDLLSKAYDKILMPTIQGLSKEGREFKGVLYFDIMVNGRDFNVIEYNARFGDPETQAVLPRLKTDLLDIFDAVIDGNLDKVSIKWDNKPRVCVVVASKGYPESYDTGKEIKIGKLDKKALVFHAGTKCENGKLYTNGGRVLSVSCCGKDLEKARENAYKEIEKIRFDGMYYRKDIGKGYK